MAAPDLAEAVVGWRAWRVARAAGGLRLVSVLRDDVWPAGRPLPASCLHGHDAPEPACECGVHAAVGATEAYRYLVGRNDAWVVHRVIGEVALWGRVVEHERGLRGALAYPVRLWVPRGRDDVVRGLAAYEIPVALDPESRFARRGVPGGGKSAVLPPPER